MKYLLDTNVVSVLRILGRNPQVEAWAASIQANQMIVATRNTKHFQPLGIRCYNPWNQPGS